MANGNTDRAARTKMRGKLRKWGMDEDTIKICVAEVARRQAAKDRGELERGAPLCLNPVYLDLQREQELKAHPPKQQEAIEEPKKDDKSYKPRYYDPLLIGAARATGKTAKAVERKNTYTTYDYNQKE